jgi:hypothetical protein
MKIRVIADLYYVSEDLSCIGMVSKEEFENSFSHQLVIGDVWEKIDDEGDFGNPMFKCIEGKWEGEKNDGWWDYEGNEDCFEVVE